MGPVCPFRGPGGSSGADEQRARGPPRRRSQRTPAATRCTNSSGTRTTPTSSTHSSRHAVHEQQGHEDHADKLDASGRQRARTAAARGRRRPRSRWRTARHARCAGTGGPGGASPPRRGRGLGSSRVTAKISSHSPPSSAIGDAVATTTSLAPVSGGMWFTTIAVSAATSTATASCATARNRPCTPPPLCRPQRRWPPGAAGTRFTLPRERRRTSRRGVPGGRTRRPPASRRRGARSSACRRRPARRLRGCAARSHHRRSLPSRPRRAAGGS